MELASDRECDVFVNQTHDGTQPGDDDANAWGTNLVEQRAGVERELKRLVDKTVRDRASSLREATACCGSAENQRSRGRRYKSGWAADESALSRASC